MEIFRQTSLDIVWPICIWLWTIMALVSLGESWSKHRKALKTIARLDRRLEKLEKQRGQVPKEKERRTDLRHGVDQVGDPDSR